MAVPGMKLRVRLVVMTERDEIGRPLNKVVWFRVRGWDRTIPVLSPVVPQNLRDKRGCQETSLSWLSQLSRNQTHTNNSL